MILAKIELGKFELTQFNKNNLPIIFTIFRISQLTNINL